jgi:hypothetical protein
LNLELTNIENPPKARVVHDNNFNEGRINRFKVINKKNIKLVPSLQSPKSGAVRENLVGKLKASSADPNSGPTPDFKNIFLVANQDNQTGVK